MNILRVWVQLKTKNFSLISALHEVTEYSFKESGGLCQDKMEGRKSERAVLAGRVIDRRFPQGWTSLSSTLVSTSSSK